MGGGLAALVGAPFTLLGLTALFVEEDAVGLGEGVVADLKGLKVNCLKYTIANPGGLIVTHLRSPTITLLPLRILHHIRHRILHILLQPRHHLHQRLATRYLRWIRLQELDPPPRLVRGHGEAHEDEGEEEGNDDGEGDVEYLVAGVSLLKDMQMRKRKYLQRCKGIERV